MHIKIKVTTEKNFHLSKEVSEKEMLTMKEEDLIDLLRVCIVEDKKFKIRRLHVLTAVVVLVLIASGTMLTAFFTSGRPETFPPEDEDDRPLKIVERGEWFALPVSETIPKLAVQPAPYVVVSEAGPSSCFSLTVCSNHALFIQGDHLQKGYGDIGYNFIIGGDGNAYAGRGWDLHGAHTVTLNNRSIGIAFIGSFDYEKPLQNQIRAFWQLIKMGVDENKLVENYTIFTYKDVNGPSSPGKNLYSLVKIWPHYKFYDSKKDIPPYKYE